MKQRWHLDGTSPTTTKCSPGKSLMISGWLSPVAYLFAETHDVQAGGYWTSDHMVEHTNRMLDAVAPRFPAADFLLIFDNR